MNKNEIKQLLHKPNFLCRDKLQHDMTRTTITKNILILQHWQQHKTLLQSQCLKNYIEIVASPMSGR